MKWLATIILFISFPVRAAPLTSENDAYNVNRAPNVSDPSQYYGEWRGHSYNPSPPDWRKIGVYQVITDRFGDGDPRNNEGKYNGYSPGVINMRHGGDFAGLTKKLDYIKGLGFDAIWISPIFQNLTGSPAGYGQIDFTLLDDRFGTLKEFRTLVSEAHLRGMYVIVDVVVNHLSDLYYPQGFKNRVAPFKIHTGEYNLLPRYPNQSYADFSVVNKFIGEGSFCDVYGRDGKKYVDTGKGSYWESDLHHNGALTDFEDPWINTLGTIYNSYNDLRLCSGRVKDKILAMTKSLIASTDIDGIRIDTPMQVPLEFLKQWTPAVKEYASSLGKKNFFMFGETYCDARKCATMIGRGKTPEMYGHSDFIDHRSAMDSGIYYGFYITLIKELFRELKPVQSAELKDFLKAENLIFDFYDPISNGNSNRMLLFYGSHDQRRLAALPNGIARARLAALMMIFWPGIPIMYQGDEQDFSSYGTALDGHAREDMMTSIAWDNHPAAVMPNKVANDNFDMANETYVYIRRLMDLRSHFWKILANDKINILWAFPQSHGTVLSFSRDDEEGKKIQLILNISDRELTLFNGMQNLVSVCHSKCSLRNFLKPKEKIETGSSGRIEKIVLSPFEGKLLYANNISSAFAPYVIEMHPSHDKVVPSGHSVVTVQFSEPMDLETVKSAIYFNGKHLDPSQVTTSDKLTFDLQVNFTEGLNTVEVSERACSQGNRAMLAPFRARLRSGQPQNIIVDKAAKTNDALINNGDLFTEDARVKIFHSAEGAQMFRIKNEPNGKWSEWQKYKEISDWSVGGTGPGWREVTVQYWVDGSSSYYVKDGIDYLLSDGVPPMQ